MSGIDARGEAHRWLRYATEDLSLAERILAQCEDAPRQACFFAQQAAEKAIKAALVFLSLDFPKTHDLDHLRGLLPDDWRAHEELPDLSQLTDWAVDARYPDEIPDPSWEEAREAVREARSVVSAMGASLADGGPDAGA
jgi:HEPN domain-containing protein